MYLYVFMYIFAHSHAYIQTRVSVCVYITSYILSIKYKYVCICLLSTLLECKSTSIFALLLPCFLRPSSLYWVPSTAIIHNLGGVSVIATELFPFWIIF